MQIEPTSYRYSHQSSEYGRNYQKHYSGDNYNTRVWELEKIVLDSLLKKYFGSHKIRRFLDFACGTGRVCSYLENKVEKSTGVDVSASMLEIAENKCQKTNFLIADITNKNTLSGEKYDLITAFRFFLNAEAGLKKSVLLQLRNLLDKNGILVLNIHGNKHSFRHLPLTLNNWFRGKKTGNEVSLKEMEEILNETGFVIKDFYPVSFLPRFFTYLPKKWWKNLELALSKSYFIRKWPVVFILVAQINEEK
jgi:SAM-dependent methyltransferase